MKIFIGSSTKHKNYAVKIAKELTASGFQVFRWWDKHVFKGGDITIERLIEMSDICDGAVFVFGPDDQTFFRQGRRNKKLASPRDNVVLEYGMFVGKQGVKRVLFVTSKNVKIPSDLHGVTYLGERGYAKKIAERFKEVFKLPPDSESPSRITVHINKQLISSLEKGGESNWSSRSLYVGAKGARAWQAVEKDAKYNGARDFNSVANAIKDIAKEKKLSSFDCIVSIGPGLGLLDKEVIPFLSGNQLVRYIPVDINFYLAHHAAETLSLSAKNIHVPFTIVGDFEDGMSHIGETIDDHTAPGRVFMMLGGTFGNLEDGENAFLNGLKDCLDDEDIAILDIFTAESGYQKNNDPLYDLKAQPKSVKRFLANGVCKESGRTVDQICKDIDNYITQDDSVSKIKNTEAFVFMSISSSKKLIHVRRYKHDDFRDYLEDLEFEVISSKSIGSASSTIGRAVFFLRKK